MREIENRLLALADEKYAAFQLRIVPTAAAEDIIGVRVPQLRKLAAQIEKEAVCAEFLRELPHRYYEEDLLHAILLSRMKPFERCVAELERFLPYVDNWAVCDTLRPRCFSARCGELLPLVKQWIASAETYTCRFGLDMLMTCYLDEGFDPAFPALAAAVQSEEYYVRMMVAWYFATALAKQWDSVIPYLEQRRLPEWTHRMTIRKACESFRISDEQKLYLRGLR